MLGIDGCPGGWIAARLCEGVLTWQRVKLGELQSLLDGASCIGIDMPMGLAESGWRECDVLGREALGAARSRLFLTPPRAVLELGWSAPNDEVQRVSRALTGQGTSRQAMGLATRILELDALLPDARVIEVHPELSFMAMAGAVLPSKHSEDGVRIRVELLEAEFGALPDGPAPLVDRLDALAALWSVRRFVAGSAIARPPGDVRDGRGVTMRIVS